MKLFVWNINQRSSRRKIPELVVTEILDYNPDIVVLTEGLNASNERKINLIQECVVGPLNDSYKFFYNIERNEYSGDNGVLIAVKKSIDGKNASDGMSEATVISRIEKMNTVREEHPDFLQIDMVVNGELLSVIGARIRVTDYVKRHEQLLSLTDHIKTLGNKNILVAGNFNNGYIHGDESKFYSGKYGTREYYLSKVGKPTVLYDTFNYHIMKDDFDAIGMTVSTPPGEQYSFGFEIDEDKNPNNGHLKEEHIITTASLKTVNPKYCQQFMKRRKASLRWYRGDNGEWSIKPPFPNHAILTADIFFNGR